MKEKNEVEIAKDTSVQEILKLTNPCTCNACTVGCRHGSGVLAEEDIPKLAAFLNITEDELKQHKLESIEKFHTTKFKPLVQRVGNKPYGICTFYDKEKGCTIHAAKPLECKIAMGCKSYGSKLTTWFMLNQFLNINDPESIRQYASYLENKGETLPGASLDELVPDKELLRKILSMEIL